MADGSYDSYYYDRAAERPLPVLRVKYADAAGSWLYSPRATARLIQRETAQRPPRQVAVSRPAQPRFSGPLSGGVGLEHHHCQPVHRRPSPQHDVRYRGLAILSWNVQVTT